MKTIPLALSSIITSTFLALAPCSLKAQAAQEFGISKVEPQLVTTPSVTYSGATQKSNPGGAKKWLEIETSFTWQPRAATDKYADDVVVNYYVLLANKSAAAPQGTLLTGQVTLTSIPAKQNDLKSVMYVSPRALERFFNGAVPSSISSAVTAYGATISYKGQVQCEKSINATGQWWNQVQQTPGYLLTKSETPFAPLNSDYYEQVKKQ